MPALLQLEAGNCQLRLVALVEISYGSFRFLPRVLVFAARKRRWRRHHDCAHRPFAPKQVAITHLVHLKCCSGLEEQAETVLVALDGDF